MASKIASGEVIACPAEGVWGLSCDPFSEQAVLTLLAMKHRAVDKGLIVVAADAAVFSEVLLPLPERVQKAIALSWPGPNTWLVPHRGAFPDWVTGNSEDVAIRVTSAPALEALCHALGGPVVSTSANPAGLAPPHRPWEVRRYFGPLLPALPGAIDPEGKPSTIRRAGDGEVIRG